MKKLILPVFLGLAACTSYPDNPHVICAAALQGMSDPEHNLYDECVDEVFWAGYKARHNAANKYRLMPR